MKRRLALNARLQPLGGAWLLVGLAGLISGCCSLQPGEAKALQKDLKEAQSLADELKDTLSSSTPIAGQNPGPPAGGASGKSDKSDKGKVDRSSSSGSGIKRAALAAKAETLSETLTSFREGLVKVVHAENAARESKKRLTEQVAKDAATIKTLEAELTAAESERSSAVEKLKAKEASLESTQADLKATQAESGKRKTKIAALEQEVEDLGAFKPQYKKAIADLKTANTKIAKVTKNRDEWKENRNEWRNAHAKLDNQLKAEVRETERLGEQLAGARLKVTELNESLKKERGEITRLKGIISRLEKDVSAYRLSSEERLTALTAEKAKTTMLTSELAKERNKSKSYEASIRDLDRKNTDASGRINGLLRTSKDPAAKKALQEIMDVLTGND